MEVGKFGERLRQLREEAGLSQGQLADRVGVNFTYLSKIESGAKPPPSKKVIGRLAEVLNVDSDELIALAGKVPSDIIEILKSPENLQSLRSGRFSKVRSADKKESFNTKLVELRQWAQMTQKELAGKVGINFTYLSKIENGVMPPPSEKVILKLAEALNTDQDELMLLAGKIPSDIAQVLKNGETLRRLRSDHAKQMARSSNKKRGNLMMLSKIFFNKSFSKVAIALVLVLAVIGSLWFASPTPVKAVEVTLPNLPTVMYSGSLHSFYAQVDINTNEAIPINSLRLDITGPTPAWVVFDVDGTITAQSGHFPVPPGITPVVVPYYAYYAYGYLYGYGYGYQAPPQFTGYGYFSHWWPSGYGYGYGYGYGLPTQAKYLVTINTTGMPLGSYEARLSVNTGPGAKRFLSPQYSFTLIPALVSPGAPAALGVVTATCSIDLTPYLDAEGRTTVEIRLVCENVTIVIPEGTRMLDAGGNPLGSMEVICLNTPPPPAGYVLVGPASECLPDGATFEPAITLTFTYEPADIPTGVSEGDLVLAYWDGDEWVMLPTTVDTVANTVTAAVTHFTPFGILAKLPVPPAPAAFDVSSLAISPATADIGEKVTISVRVANTGDLTGSYGVTLKVNNVAVDTKDVTLDGGASKIVIFTTTQDTAGTYAVAVNGLSGTFTVKAPPVPPVPAAFEVSQLSISPAEVQVGETVTVSATVANTGEVEGSYTVTLKINGATEATKKVTLAGGQSTKVTFSVVRDVAGSYQVDIDGQTGSFTVAKAPLAWWIWLIVGIAVIAVIGVVVWQIRRRAA